jgi:hypothetical protein
MPIANRVECVGAGDGATATLLSQWAEEFLANADLAGHGIGKVETSAASGFSTIHYEKITDLDAFQSFCARWRPDGKGPALPSPAPGEPRPTKAEDRHGIYRGPR